MRTVLPGATLGILGGGQLGRMFALEAKRMGYRVVTLEPSPDSPCGQVADVQIQADYADETALRSLADQCDVITYEFENINAHAVEFLEGLGKAVHPGSRVLRVSQDRLLEKGFLRDAGLGVAAFMAVDTPEDVRTAASRIGLPAVIKTVRGGYDGKGQAVVHDLVAAEAAFAKLHREDPLIWERKVPFLKELSVVACRGIDGKATAFPVSENVHVENILDTGIVPARISKTAADRARAMAEAVGDKLGIVGAYCVELFLCAGDEILVNEIAPRPHNSGHYTLDACVCSQFEQQVRAICGLPLGTTTALKPSVMINILGDGKGNTLFGTDEAMREENLVFHLYGKYQAAAKRKMGHFTVLADSVESALEKARDARAHLRWG
ncbi:MAG: 5-(carboxyamino)imidazole ribonucleotide synthase [Fibrobacterota bacterium]|nr:5-(carboxyamino)imidazole ribonucleotide synthase [Fibrobacterota bacterium]